MVWYSCVLEELRDEGELVARVDIHSREEAACKLISPLTDPLLVLPLHVLRFHRDVQVSALHGLLSQLAVLVDVVVVKGQLRDGKDVDRQVLASLKLLFMLVFKVLYAVVGRAESSNDVLVGTNIGLATNRRLSVVHEALLPAEGDRKCLLEAHGLI